MPLVLSYPSQQTILPYLEHNIQTCLIRHCPSLPKLKPSEILFLDSLSLHDDGLILNGVYYKIIESRHVYIEFKLRNNVVTRQIPNVSDGNRALAVLVRNLFKQGIQVKVDNLEVHLQYQYLARLLIENERTFEAQGLTLQIFTYLHEVVPLLSPSSFPLARLSTYIPQNNTADYSITQNLLIKNDNAHQAIRTLISEQNIQYIELEDALIPWDKLQEVVRRWKASGREIGTRLTMNLAPREEFEVTRLMRWRCGGRAKYLVNGSSRKSCSSFPFSPTSELVIYKKSKTMGAHKKIMMEVVPRESVVNDNTDIALFLLCIVLCVILISSLVVFLLKFVILA